MILAAGYGTRLSPYTDFRPKPLFPLLNIPLLVATVARLQASGINHIIINCHHLREQIREQVSAIDGIILQEESTILGTGGGLRQALDKMHNEPLLVTNGDIYHAIDYQWLYKQHLHTESKVSLAMHDYPRFNMVEVKEGRITGFKGHNLPHSMAFTGLHIIEPEVLKEIVPGEKSCIISRYQNLLEQKCSITAVPIENTYWTDIGTPGDYLDLHRGFLTGEVPCWSEIGETTSTPFRVSKKAKIGENMIMEDWACIGDATIGNNVTIARSVIWDGAEVADNSKLIDAIIVK